ncbi:Guanine deaminase [Colletotrichum tanaceti]|uniref:Guanine deaminase n=1 Tax=Colletotrichum tanaceti TaxID=1306861 RepID=A0A4U6X5I0_9PEZI|nr:Guanine deaminase [Colletotrichum tanaceti]TKW50495.1 Guanine deaminase [Colletotrichum tanaceti]
MFGSLPGILFLRAPLRHESKFIPHHHLVHHPLFSCSSHNTRSTHTHTNITNSILPFFSKHSSSLSNSTDSTMAPATTTTTPPDPDPNILRRCVELAREALDAGDDPFGSVLVGADGAVLREDRNRVNTGEAGDGRRDATLHPELALARWAQRNLGAADRAAASVYTSGEHCPMCAAAHAWVGLGPVVYVSSSEQLASWTRELELELELGAAAAGGTTGRSKVSPLPIRAVAPNIVVRGPIPGLDEEVKALHKRNIERQVVRKGGCS